MLLLSHFPIAWSVPVCQHRCTMFLWISTNFSKSALTLLLILFATGAKAQTFDFENSHSQTMTLDGNWRFQLGDDPDGKLGWADPAFDDHQWRLLDSSHPWTEQGFKAYGGFAWYRFKVLLPETHRPLAICIPRIHSSFEIFADGRLVGKFGGMPPHEEYYTDNYHIYTLVPPNSEAGRTLSIAIRVWRVGWFDRAGGPEGAATVGDLDALKALKTQYDWGRFWSSTSSNALMLMNLVAAFVGFFLFSMRVRDREYLWFGLYELLTGVAHLCTDWVMFYPTLWKSYWVLDECLAAASWPLFLLFVFRILNGRRNWLFWAAVATAPASALVSLAYVAQMLGYYGWRIAWIACLVPYFVCILALLYRRARQGVPDAQLMLIPVAICYISWFSECILVLILLAGHSWVLRDFGWIFEWSQWPFPFSFQDIADMLMLLAVLAVLPLRFARSRRDEERLAAEMESARTVQQVLIPSEIPIVPGFEIQCVYRPAGYVGGDFFQIIPIADGGLLIAIGDVSGKGMPAAMTVSLLVGTLRTLAHFTQSPSEILSAMNQRMMSRSQGGFTTCLVVRVASDYTLAVANAGHIAPYLQGIEVEVINGLPLGLAEDTTYAERKLTLPEDAQLTLITDGVVEAKAPAGELLGFERTADLSTQSAEFIADAAQNFGQEDDITVLTLVRRNRPTQPSRRSAMTEPALS
jgi:hypothetical protein